MHEPARKIGEGLRAGVGDHERIADYQVVVVQPDRRDAVKGHVGFEDRAVALAHAAGEFAPGRRVADPDRIPDSGVLRDPMSRDHLAPRRVYLLAGDARPGCVEDRFQPFGHHVRYLRHALGRLAEVDAARERRVVAMATATHLDEEHLVRGQRRVDPTQVRHTAGLARHRVWRLAGESAAGGDAVELRHHVALAHPGAHRVDRGPHRGRGDGAGLHQVPNLAIGLAHAYPVHGEKRIHEGGLGKVGGQDLVPARGVVVLLHLDADALRVPAPRPNDLGEQLHRVALRRGHVLVRVRDDVRVVHEHGDAGASRVHSAPEPDWLLFVGGDDDHLRGIERPSVVAGEVKLVGRARHEEHVHADLFHPMLGTRDAIGELGVFE